LAGTLIVIVVVRVVPVHLHLAVVPVHNPHIAIRIARARYFYLLPSVITDNLLQNYLRLTGSFPEFFYEASRMRKNLHQKQTSSFLYLPANRYPIFFQRFRPVVSA